MTGTEPPEAQPERIDIDPTKIIEKLLMKVTQLIQQVAQYEAVIDQLAQERLDLRAQIGRLQNPE